MMGACNDGEGAPAVGESDACARGSDTSGRASQWPWPSTSTIPQEDRGRPGPGRGITSWTARRRSGRIPLPTGRSLAFWWSPRGRVGPRRLGARVAKCFGLGIHADSFVKAKIAVLLKVNASKSEDEQSSA